MELIVGRPQKKAGSFLFANIDRIKIMKKLLLVFAAAMVFAGAVFAQTKPGFSIEGHRGARGWVPENTIPSFIKALELGADTIELDLAVSADGKLVVSHDPYFVADISLDPKGQPIDPAKQKEHNIHKMKYAEIRKYDVGSLGNKGFPDQIKMKVHKPLLSDVFRAVDEYLRKKGGKRTVRYNIEIKSDPQGDGIFFPQPAVFAKKVLDEILKYKKQNSVIVQSFDVRPLQELNKANVKLPLALLVGNPLGVEKNIEKLGFVPNTYSPHFGLVDAATVEACHKMGMKIVPWTVNETTDIEKMKKFDLDGIITDYPDRVVKIYGN